MRQNTLVSLLLAVCVLFVSVAMTGRNHIKAREAVPLLSCPDPVEGDLCTGCQATRRGDSPWSLGVITYAASGYTVTATLTVKSGTCTWQQSNPPEPGMLFCWPNKNCEFYPKVMITGPGNFHSNRAPCDLSAGGVINLTLATYLGACNGAEYTSGISFYTGHDCQTGGNVGYAMYSGYCWTCGGNT
jgi:hypothetical protein